MFKKSFSFLFFTSFIAISIYAITVKYKKSIVSNTNRRLTPNEISTYKKRAVDLKKYIDEQGYQNEYCFIINMGVPSGKPRFAVYNLVKDSIEEKGLVTHGSGSETQKGDLVFKNIPGSLATSIGKYKIGSSYNGKFGLAYKLHGLDASNSKAFERFVVLHSHECVPNDAVYPQPICVSWGCPTVSPQFLKKLQSLIDASEKPVLLDIIYEKE
jgi:L,D-transpeptidase catalytic domain